MKVAAVVLLWYLLWVPCVGQESDNHGFVPTIKLAIGSPRDIAAGDFNEDGNIDLVVTATQGFTAAVLGASEPTWTRNLILLLGDGKGGFGAPIHLLSETEKSFIDFSGIFVKDMNADGHLDIVLLGVKGVTNPQGSILLLLGDGKGHFSEPQRLEIGVAPSDAVSADFNEDGRMDIAVADPYSHEVYLLVQNKGDTFGWMSPKIAFHQEHHYPAALAVGDFNEDGHIDLAVAGFKYIGPKQFLRFVVLLLGDGTGRFTEGKRVDFSPTEEIPHSLNLIPVDYDHDGHLDLIMSTIDEAVVLLGNGKAEFKQKTLFPLDNPDTSLYICELNADTCWDWVTLDYSNDKTEVIISPCKTGRYGPQGLDVLVPYLRPVAVAVIDVNNDDKNDVVLMRNMQTDTEAGGKHEEWTYIDILLNSLILSGS